MFELALPVVITYLGLMTMGLVDLVCVGRISATATGAVGVGTSFFSWFMIIGIGLLTGLEFLVSHAHGSGLKEEGRIYWAQGFWLSWILGIPLTVVLIFAAHHLAWFGLNPTVVGPSRDYLSILALSLIPIYLFTASREYLQSLGVAKPAMILLLSANVLNALANWSLVFGMHLGPLRIPALGVIGSAMATLTSRIFLAVGMTAVQHFHDREHSRRIPLRLDPMLRLLKLGSPSALQMVFEVGVFALSTTLAARLAAESLAAHQIVLNIASVTFMVPLGIGSATAVLVGKEIGRGNPKAAAWMGWKGLCLGAGFMTFSGISLLLFSTQIIEFYTTDPRVITLAGQILLVAALFQLSDGIQTSATGALRGLADTRTPMLANLLGHWCIGLPVGIFLCFHENMGLKGLWIGLFLGLTTVATLLGWRWWSLSRKTASQVILST